MSSNMTSSMFKSFNKLKGNFSSKKEKEENTKLDPCKITLKSDGLTSVGTLHSSPVSVEGYPAEVPGSFRWYRISSDQNFVDIEGVHGDQYFPSLDDVDCRICCQFCPDNPSVPTSNFAEVGPLLLDETIQADANFIIDSGTGKMEIKYGANEISGQLMFNNKRISIQSATGESLGKIKIKSDFTFEMDSGNPCKFCIKNSKRTPLVQAETCQSRERDILALVIRNMASKRGKNGKKDTDVVKLSIDVVGLRENWMAKYRATNEELLELKERFLRSQNDLLRSNTNLTSSNNQLERLNANLAMQLDENRELKEKGTDMETRLDMLMEDNGRLKDLQKEAGSNLIKKEKKSRGFEKQTVELHEQMQQLRKSVETISKQKFDIEQDKQDLQQTLKTKDEDYLNLIKEKDEVQRVLDERTYEGKKLEEKVEILKKSFDELKDSSSSDQATLQDLKNTMNDYQLATKQDCMHKKELQSHISELEKKSEKQTQELASFQGINQRHSEVTSDLLNTNAELSNFRAKCEYLTKQLDQELGRYQKLTETHNEMKLEVDKHKSKSLSLKAELDSYRSSVTQQKYDEALKQIEILQNKLSLISEKACNYQKKLEETLEEMSDCKITKKKIEEKLKESFESANRLTSERNFYKKKTESMMTDINKFMQTDINLQQRKQHENKLLNQTKSQMAELSIERNDALSAMETLRRQMDDARHETENVRRQYSLASQMLSEDQKSIISRNLQLQRLANDLSDSLADKDQQIVHQKSVMRMLGDRVRELEIKI